MSILETVKSKLKANTYVMSCYLTEGDLYAEMKEHLRLLADELDGIKSNMKMMCTVDDNVQDNCVLDDGQDGRMGCKVCECDLSIKQREDCPNWKLV